MTTENKDLSLMISVPKNVKEALENPLPAFLIKQRPGGRQKLSYISGSTVIGMLNNIFGYMWDWEVDKEWMQTSEPKFNPKYDKEPQHQGPVAHVKGTLTVHIPQENGSLMSIKKSGFGSKSVIGGQNEQESVFKAAGTDALKKAASLLGIGISLYRDEDEQFYFDELNNSDIWTESTIAENQDLLNFVAQFREDFSATDEMMSKIIMQFSNNAFSNLEDIVPSNISAFVAHLKKVIKTQEEVSE